MSFLFLFPPRRQYQVGIVNGHHHAAGIVDKAYAHGGRARRMKCTVAEVDQPAARGAFARPGEQAFVAVTSICWLVTGPKTYVPVSRGMSASARGMAGRHQRL